MQVQNQNVTQEKNPSPSQQKAEINAPAMQNASQSLAGKKNAVAEIQGDGISKDKTSKYLKVLSRIEGLLVKDALPEAAVKGFVGAVKKQLNQLTEGEKQTLLKLPEARQLELKNLEELTDQIEEKLADKETAKEMLSLLKNPRFASMMKTEDSLNSAGTYKPSDLKPATAANSAAPPADKPATQIPSQASSIPAAS
tara:strand:- start:152 stop:742 length:591 start_codon:yes stop_codon:yes gene_type:complete